MLEVIKHNIQNNVGIHDLDSFVDNLDQDSKTDFGVFDVIFLVSLAGRSISMNTKLRRAGEKQDNYKKNSIYCSYLMNFLFSCVLPLNLNSLAMRSLSSFEGNSAKESSASNVVISQAMGQLMSFCFLNFSSVENS